jgi:hypothetical protein
MRFFSGSTARSKDPPSSSGANPKIKISSESCAIAPTLDDINGTASSSAKDAPESVRNNHDKISRRSSMDSSTGQHRQKHKERPLQRSQSEIRAKTSSNGNSDPPTGHVAGAGTAIKKERRDNKKKKQDVPQQGRMDNPSSGNTGSSNRKDNLNNQGLRDTSFQDVLKNLNTDASGSSKGRRDEKNPFVVPSPSSPRSDAARHMPTLDENKEDTNISTKLDLPGFKSQNEPSSALQALLGNANFSSDASVGTINTTTQCALSLGHLIEEMQVEFQKLKKQKNKAEMYAEKLHTDYVRMQEGLERDFEKVCQERDQLNVAREKDSMTIDKLKEDLKALKTENSALKESMGAIEDRSRKSEEENGRMKIALEALLIRSGALDKDGKPNDAKHHSDGARRGKKVRQQDLFNDSNGSNDSRRGNDAASSRRGKFEPGSLSCSPDIRPQRKHMQHPMSADCVKPMLDSALKKAVTLPFDSQGKHRSNLKHLSETKEVLEGYHNSFASSSEICDASKNDDEDSNASNHTMDDGTMDSPTPH